MADIDCAEYLEDDEAIAAYIGLAVKEGNKNLLRRCIKDAARARMVNKFAKDHAIDRKEVWKLLMDSAEPPSNALAEVMDAFAVHEEQPVG